MGWQLAITDQADSDLGNVVGFLAEKSPATAERIGLEMVDLIFSLDQMSNRGAAMRKRPSRCHPSGRLDTALAKD
jgi:hypothetical protein